MFLSGRDRPTTAGELPVLVHLEAVVLLGDGPVRVQGDVLPVRVEEVEAAARGGVRDRGLFCRSRSKQCSYVWMCARITPRLL